MIRCFASEAQLYLQLKNGSIEVAGASASLAKRQDDDDDEEEEEEFHTAKVL